MNLSIAFKRGFQDPTKIEDDYRFVRVDLTTFQIVEQDNLFNKEIEDIQKTLDFVKSKDTITINDLVDFLRHQGWKLF